MNRSELGARTVAAAAVARLREPLAGEGVWVVGGTVRDIALGREPGEVDLAVRGAPGRVARKLARALEGVAFELSAEFPAWRVRGREGDWQVDVAMLRGEDGPDTDLGLRDFTVGAIAVDLNTGALHDPVRGLDDLEAGVIRACSERSFTDDPLRLMRAARLAANFGWTIDPATLRLARAAAPEGAAPAGERILAELLLLMAGPDPIGGIRWMDEIGLLESVLPEIGALKGVTQGPNHHLDVYGHTLEVMEGVLRVESEPERFAGEHSREVVAHLGEPLADGISRATGLRLAALFHDCAKPRTRRQEDGYVSFRGHDRVGADLAGRVLGTRLRSSRRLSEYVAGITRNHLVLGFLVAERPLGRRRIYEYLVRTDPDPVDVTLLTVADRLAARGASPIAGDEMVAGHLELAREMIEHGLEWEKNGPPAPLVSGHDLADALGIEPGPRMGEIIRELAAARYAGEIDTAEQAIDHARRHLEAE